MAIFLKKPKTKKTSVTSKYTGIASFMKDFEQSPPPKRVVWENNPERRNRVKHEKRLDAEKQLEEERDEKYMKQLST